MKMTIGTGKRKLERATKGTLDGSFGADRGKRLLVSFCPGDLLVLRPLRTQRPEMVSVFDVYRFAIMSRIKLETHNRKKGKIK
jgi:hypothetical protein